MIASAAAVLSKLALFAGDVQHRSGADVQIVAAAEDDSWGVSWNAFTDTYCMYEIYDEAAIIAEDRLFLEVLTHEISNND